MKKNFLKLTVIALMTATTMTNLPSLGVSAATTNPSYNDYCNLVSNNNTYCLDMPDESETSTVTTSTSLNSVIVYGLPKLPTKYPITIQVTAENKILQLMNSKRAQAGLSPLTMNSTLRQVARYKSDHMIQYNYFSHTTPQGTMWINWLQRLGYRYTTTGENIAYNTYDPVALFTQWWNSPGHRANMMNPSYHRVGIGVIKGAGKFMGTQTFSN
jgi:uncharacterized protein YkwD